MLRYDRRQLYSRRRHTRKSCCLHSFVWKIDSEPVHLTAFFNGLDNQKEKKDTNQNIFALSAKREEEPNFDTCL